MHLVTIDYNLIQIWYAYLKRFWDIAFQTFRRFWNGSDFRFERNRMSEFLSETSVWDAWCLCYDTLTYKLAKLYTFVYYKQ